MILPRRECDYYDRYCRSSAWWDWGRWVAFAVIVGCAFIIFFIFACYNARRRRTRGLRPHPGTAWLAGPPPSYQQHQQHPQTYADPYFQHPPPPQYTPQPQAYGYFGGQQTGIELQSPPNAYQGGPAYAPPPGPPPTSKA
ncbi:resistance to Congo red protein [Aspergillus affinis]|uniref:resistance to Congo red protein n=1 Tax=Aspergillus affinis TaxID=1070780 RepID=UPI0022FE3CB8|nr:uncharacterized protein KD926_003962 [Aspergillus affinis]KAI9046124.1 hypothetical protein KD926_003962 [Aspergillus affinis]